MLKNKVIYKHKFVSIRKSYNIILQQMKKHTNINKKVTNGKNYEILKLINEINLNKHILKKELLIAHIKLNLHFKNWLVDNIKDKKLKINNNRIEIFEKSNKNKSLPMRLLNNYRINKIPSWKKRLDDANRRRNNLILIRINLCKESSELLKLKKIYVDQSYEMHKSFKNLNLNYKLKSANLSKHQQIAESSYLRKIKQEEIHNKKAIFNLQKQKELERKNLKIVYYESKINQLNKNKENISYEK